MPLDLPVDNGIHVVPLACGSAGGDNKRQPKQVSETENGVAWMSCLNDGMA
jgi:hypothetical protein